MSIFYSLEACDQGVHVFK